MKPEQIAQKTDKELNQMVIDKRQELAKLMTDLRTKQMKNVRKIRNTKKDIARALTIRHERELSKEANHG